MSSDVVPSGGCETREFFDFAVVTFGCKLNQAESESVLRGLREAGMTVAGRMAPARSYVINTCSVTHVADRKSRHAIRMARRLSPDARIVVSGCFSECHGQEALRAGADLVLANGDKSRLPEELLSGSPRKPIVPGEDPSLRTRSFVKVQEGCDDVCSYCVVPRSRGRSRAASRERVLAEVKSRVAEGVREIVLTGTQLGECDGGLPALLAAVLSEAGESRVRVSSVQPYDVTPDLLALWSDGRLCRHFHVALQSGSDVVLSAMRRRYAASEFLRVVEALRNAVPEVCITTDVMAGFPGESEADFEETLRMCREAGFAKMHVFPFSSRPHTLAAKMASRVAEPARRDRVERLLALNEEMEDAWRREMAGRKVTVLWEEMASPEGLAPVWEGLTDNYVRVTTRSAESLRNTFRWVRLGAPAGDAVECELLAR